MGTLTSIRPRPLPITSLHILRTWAKGILRFINPLVVQVVRVINTHKLFIVGTLVVRVLYISPECNGPHIVLIMFLSVGKPPTLIVVVFKQGHTLYGAAPTTTRALVNWVVLLQAR